MHVCCMLPVASRWQACCLRLGRVGQDPHPKGRGIRQQGWRAEVRSLSPHLCPLSTKTVCAGPLLIPIGKKTQPLRPCAFLFFLPCACCISTFEAFVANNSQVCRRRRRLSGVDLHSVVAPRLHPRDTTLSVFAIGADRAANGVGDAVSVLTCRPFGLTSLVPRQAIRLRAWRVLSLNPKP